MRTPHTSFRRGKAVHVVLRDGTTFDDKFVERTGKFVILENYGRLKAGNISSMSIRNLKLSEEQDNGTT